MIPPWVGFNIIRRSYFTTCKKKKKTIGTTICVCYNFPFFSFTTAAPSVLVIRRHNLEVKILSFEIYSSSYSLTSATLDGPERPRKRRFFLVVTVRTYVKKHTYGCPRLRDPPKFLKIARAVLIHRYI